MVEIDQDAIRELREVWAWHAAGAEHGLRQQTHQLFPWPRRRRASHDEADAFTPAYSPDFLSVFSLHPPPTHPAAHRSLPSGRSSRDFAMVNAPKKAAHRSLFGTSSAFSTRDSSRDFAMALGASRPICAFSKAKARPPSPAGQYVFMVRGGKGKGTKGQSKGTQRAYHCHRPPLELPPPSPPGLPEFGPDTSLDETDKDFLVYLEAALRKMRLHGPEDEDVRDELLSELQALIAKTC